ncbi:MAG: hypothetical protein ACT4PW_02500 [Acidimicrobiia bacterium]
MAALGLMAGAGARVPGGARSVRLDPDALAALEEQRRFLSRSLDDLGRERDAGDIDDIDFQTLRSDYEARLASVTTAVEEGRATFAAAPRPDRRRTSLVVAVVVLVALASGVAVAQVAGRRGAGQNLSGDDLEVPSREQLALCLAQFAQAGDVVAGAACYDEVAARDPSNLQARAYGPGVRVMAGDPSAGPEFLSDLVALTGLATANPDYPDVHAFLAVGFYKLGRVQSALAELDKLDALDPPPTITAILAGFRAEIEEAAEATPGSSASPASSSPAPPSSPGPAADVPAPAEPLNP